MKKKRSLKSPEPGLLTKAKSLFSSPPGVPVSKTSSVGDILFARVGMAEPVSLGEVFEGGGRKITVTRAAEARSRVVSGLKEGLRNGILVGLCEAYVCYLQELMDLEEKLRRRAGVWPGVFRWSSSMAGDGGWFQSGCYGFEVGMMLSTYAMTKMKSALEDGDGRDIDFLMTNNVDLLNEQSKQFQQAAGIFEHLELKLFPNVIAEVGNSAPPDVHPDVAKSLKFLALAISQFIAFRLAVIKKMSPGACSKSALGAHQLLQSGASAAKSFSDQHATSIHPQYLETNAILSKIVKGIAYKFLATEAHNAQKYGAAVTYARLSLNLFDDNVLKHGLMKRGTAKEKQEIKTLYEKYETENSRIYYEQEPGLESLPETQGRVLVKAAPYLPAKAPHIPTRRVSAPTCSER